MTMWEDLGDEAILSMRKTEGAIDSSTEAMEEMTQVKYDNITSQIETISRQIQNDFIIPIAEQLLPILKDGLKWIGDNLNWLLPILTGLGIAFATYFAVAKISGLIGVIKTVIGLVKGGTGVMSALNTVMSLNPIGLIVAAIAGLVAAFILLWNNCEDFRSFWIGLWEQIQEYFNAFIEWITPILEEIGTFLVETFKQAWDFIVETWNAVQPYFLALWEGIKAIFTPAIEWFGTLFSTAWDNIKIVWDVVTSYFSTIWETVKGIFSVVKDVLSGNFSDAWEGIKNVFSTWGDFYKGLFDSATKIFSNIWATLKNGAKKAWDGIKGVFSGAASWFGSIFSNAWTKVKNVFSTGGKIFSGIKDGIITAFKKVVNTIISGLNTIVSKPFTGLNNVLNDISSVDILGIKPFEWLTWRAPIPQIPLLAKGGILTQPTLNIAGEKGAEAIIPLDKLESWMNNGFNSMKAYANDKMDRMIDLLEKITEKSNDMYIDGEKVSASLSESNDNESGKRLMLKRRGLSV